MSVTYCEKGALPASLWVGSLSLEEDDFRLQTDDPGQQRLLVVGQCTPLLALGCQVLLQRSDPSHQVAFVESLERVIRRAGRSACASSSTSSFPARLVVRCRRRGKGVGRLAVQLVGAGISADHLKAQPGEA